MTIRVRFDGKVFSPDETVDLQPDRWYDFELLQDRKSQMIIPPERNDLATASLEEIGVGGWSERTDIDDDFAHQLRQRVQKPRYTLKPSSNDSAR